MRGEQNLQYLSLVTRTYSSRKFFLTRWNNCRDHNTSYSIRRTNRKTFALHLGHPAHTPSGQLLYIDLYVASLPLSSGPSLLLRMVRRCRHNGNGNRNRPCGRCAHTRRCRPCCRRLLRYKFAFCCMLNRSLAPFPSFCFRFPLGTAQLFRLGTGFRGRRCWSLNHLELLPSRSSTTRVESRLCLTNSNRGR